MERNTSVYMFYLIINCKPSFHRIFITDTIIPFKIQAYHHLLDNFSQYRRWKTTYILNSTQNTFVRMSQRRWECHQHLKYEIDICSYCQHAITKREWDLHTSSKPENKVKNDDDDYEILLQTFYILPVLLLLSNGTNNNNNNIYPYLLFANKAHTHTQV